ncbi:MAG TPA: ATP phosphoribosyltransferase [Actinomycetales bacterium]|nr:ATP phosphoribosyltransferase [Actinomycetales bacterium]
MLRIAVPNKGGLAEPASEMLREAGYRQRSYRQELVLVDEANNVEFFFLRPRDIAVYVGSGTVDAGITGRDLLLDSEAPAVEHLALDFGASTFRYAAPQQDISRIADLAGKRVATSYPVLVAKHLASHGVTAEVVRLDGAVETAVRLGVAEAVADVVSTGSTLRAAGLEIFGDPILRSEAILIRRAGEAPAGLEVVTRRLRGVLLAQQYVLMDYVVPTDLMEQAFAITPGLESPTVSSLHEGKSVAVRVMVNADQTNNVMDQLYDLGARAILVTSIHACRI